ncbi:hypothetical protein ACH4RG_23030 [Streptomyces sp. NPDC021019]|uniref:hypothetical protein n=1 Tax=Streptomyces sp. NPDC021019 TaxID=3365108 RepID=UPI0037AF7F80
MSLIHVQPAPARRQAFAQWGVAQDPKVRTSSAETFAVDAALFAVAPEALLIGSLVDGRPYVSPTEGTPPARLLDCGTCFEEDGQEVHPHPECTEGLVLAGEAGPETVALLPPGTDLLGVATAEGLDATVDGLLEATPGDVLPDVPQSAYGPDSVTLDPVPEEAAAGGSDSSDQSTEDTPPADGYVCDVCPRAFPTERGRDTHRRMAHHEES